MTVQNYDVMDIDDLRRYVLQHRADIAAFEAYIDRSRADGRIVSVNSEDSHWEQEIAKKMPSYHHPHEEDLWDQEIEVEYGNNIKETLRAYLLRLYPESFNGYDAYLDIPRSCNPEIKSISLPHLQKKWQIITGPTESQIKGYFRGDYSENNPPAWVYGLKLASTQV